MEQKKRQRSTNFNNAEVQLLINLVEKYVQIIENKKTDAVTNKDKENTWKVIETAFNSSGISTIERTWKTLKLKYEGIKKNTKKKSSVQRQEMYRTGGGPSNAPDFTDLEQKVISICSNIKGLEARHDSDDVSRAHTVTDSEIIPSETTGPDINEPLICYNIENISEDESQKDPRVSDWLLMSSPKVPFLIIVTYLVLIKLVLPNYMKNRKPYDLRNVIKWYNVMQIISNAVVSWGIMTSGWTTTYTFGCELPDYSMNPEPLRMLRFMWWTIILKLVELLETVFFILRKKDNQASFLHVYHHASTLFIMWTAVKFIGGGIASFSPMLNTAVHVVMYSYYLLSSEGSPTIKGLLAKYKKWLTIIQMVQFTVMLVYSSQVFLPSCPAPTGIAYMYFPNVIFVYYMFYKFFKNNYLKGNSKKT